MTPAMADPKPATPPAKPAKPAAAPAKPAAAASAKPAAAASAKPGTAIAVPEGEAPREGRIAWVLGWIVLPATVIGGIFGGGVILGANDHDGWFARSVMWVVGLF
jgi:hypothetical protein